MSLEIYDTIVCPQCGTAVPIVWANYLVRIDSPGPAYSSRLTIGAHSGALVFSDCSAKSDTKAYRADCPMSGVAVHEIERREVVRRGKRGVPTDRLAKKRTKPGRRQS